MGDGRAPGSVQVRGRQGTYAATVEEVAEVITRFQGVQEVRHYRGRAFEYRIDRFDGSGYGCRISVVPQEVAGSLVTVSASGWGYNWTPIKNWATAARVRGLQRGILTAISRELGEPRNQSLNL
jgi:hypothetical protein